MNRRKIILILSVLMLTLASVSIVALAAEGDSPAQEVWAIPTASKVLVDDEATQFGAYLINGSNYFKLRDIAFSVSGTSKQFEVSWDETLNSISLTTNSPYTVIGGEMGKVDKNEKQGILSNSSIYVDGQVTSISAYKIDGNNYFKLRDLARTFDIGITYDETTKNIGIETNQSYSE